MFPVIYLFSSCFSSKERYSLSYYARLAVLESAQNLSCPLKFPLSYQKNINWSLSHKNGAVAGVFSRQSIVGIDIEKIELRHQGLLRKIISQSEWEIIENSGYIQNDFVYLDNKYNEKLKKWKAFYHIYTGKEAVLKANGIGIKGLSQCKLIEWKRNSFNFRKVYSFLNRQWFVYSVELSDYICSVATFSEENIPHFFVKKIRL